MNVVFITLSRISDINERGIYNDLLRQFTADGHDVYIIKPLERRLKQPTSLTNNGRVHILGVHTLNIQKTNVIEKGIGTVLLEYQYLRATKKYLKGINFDLILYSTPPITIVRVIEGLKSRCKALTYLMLKDIFPQNAVDIGMFSAKSPFNRYFRHKEQKLYVLSDYIGCMSPANVDYIIKHNPTIHSDRVELCPNAMEMAEQPGIDVSTIKTQYGLPLNKRIFVYGGNLGKPQGIDFLIKVLDANKNNDKAFFLIVGSGTEAHKIEKWVVDNEPQNIKYLCALSRSEYDDLVRACDVGMIFLDRRFTIPNYPSRLLAYLNNRMPILIASDPNTDIGRIAESNGYGRWCESGALEECNKIIEFYTSLSDEELSNIGAKGYEFLKQNYDVRQAYQTIISHIR